MSSSASKNNNFNPLPPCRGRHFYDECSCVTEQFQSTPSMQRETVYELDSRSEWTISIHSLHAEGDIFRLRPKPIALMISIHSLHAEGD